MGIANTRRVMKVKWEAGSPKILPFAEPADILLPEIDDGVVERPTTYRPRRSLTSANRSSPGEALGRGDMRDVTLALHSSAEAFTATRARGRPAWKTVDARKGAAYRGRREAPGARGGGRGMTEAEWLDCLDPEPMLAFVQGKASNRKLRLFACAGCRWVWHLLNYGRSRRAVEVAERYADGKATRNELAAARTAADAAWDSRDGVNYAAWAATCAADPDAAIWNAVRTASAALMDTEYTSRSCQANLLRCLFGNPFRPVTLNPSWQTPTVTSLAHAAYGERILPSGHLDNTRLGVLADALEEAGCTDLSILEHLRSPGPHVRGCHVVDLLTGRK
jgi:hypothetical protein